MSISILLPMIYHMTKFDVPTQSGFWVIGNIVLDNLSKKIHVVIIIPFAVFYLEFENVGKEEEETQKLEYLKNKTSFLGEIKAFS